MRISVLLYSLLTFGSAFLPTRVRDVKRRKATAFGMCVQSEPELTMEVQSSSPRSWMTRRARQASIPLFLVSLGIIFDGKVALADAEELKRTKANAEFAQRLQDTRDLNSGFLLKSAHLCHSSFPFLSII